MGYVACGECVDVVVVICRSNEMIRLNEPLLLFFCLCAVVECPVRLSGVLARDDIDAVGGTGFEEEDFLHGVLGEDQSRQTSRSLRRSRRGEREGEEDEVAEFGEGEDFFASCEGGRCCGGGGGGVRHRCWRGERISLVDFA